MTTKTATWGERVLRYRRRHHISQERLARTLSCTVFTISRWERGISAPSSELRADFERLERLADWTGGRGGT